MYAPRQAGAGGANVGHPSRTDDLGGEIKLPGTPQTSQVLKLRHHRYSRRGLLESGKRTVKMAPFVPPAFFDSTCTLPPCRCAISLHTHNPRPVPTSFLVVKNGSKIRLMFSGAIPGPSSSTFSRIES